MNRDDLILPPHAVESEQSVLGALLLDNSAMDRIANVLDESHFFRADHRIIWRKLADMILANIPADVVTVAEELETAGTLDDAGGLGYLVDLAQNTPSAANVHRYAAIVLEKWQARSLMAAGHEIATMATTMPVDEAMTAAQERISTIAEGSSKGEAVHIAIPTRAMIDMVDAAYSAGGGIVGLSTGLADLDDKLGGLRGGQLIIVGGRPAMGKTSFAMGIGSHVSGTGTPVLVLSMEMPATELAAREVARIGKLSVSAMMRGNLRGDEDWARLTHGLSVVRDLPMYVDDQGGLSLLEAVSKIRMNRRKHGIGMVVIDYLQLMRGIGENRNQELESITRAMKAIAKELDIPIVVLSQLSRKCEERTNKRPVSSDLRESGALEQDADVILFIYRDEVYNPDSPDKGTAEIIISKQRNGPTGRIRTVFHGEYATFANFSGEQFPAREDKPKNWRGM